MASTVIVDPILGLIADPPDVFLSLPPDEQVWRGRLWLVTWCTGFPPDMAWWFVLRDASEPDIVKARATMKRVADEEIPVMVAARIRFDAELARQAALGGQ